MTKAEKDRRNQAFWAEVWRIIGHVPGERQGDGWFAANTVPASVFVKGTQEVASWVRQGIEADVAERRRIEG